MEKDFQTQVLMIPSEVWSEEILSFLTKKETCKFGFTSKKFQELEDLYWKSKLIQNGLKSPTYCFLNNKIFFLKIFKSQFFHKDLLDSVWNIKLKNEDFMIKEDNKLTINQLFKVIFLKNNQKEISIFLHTHSDFTNLFIIFLKFADLLNSEDLDEKKEIEASIDYFIEKGIEDGVIRSQEIGIVKLFYKYVENEKMFELHLSNFKKKWSIDKESKTQKLYLPINFGSKIFNLISHKPENLAKQLTLYSSKLFKKIKITDFSQEFWKREMKDNFPEFHLLYDTFRNNLSSWVTQTILQETILMKRITLFIFMINLFLECHKNHDLQNAFAILHGLQHFSITRLKVTKNGIYDTKIEKKFEKIQKKYETDNNLNVLRNLAAEIENKQYPTNACFLYVIDLTSLAYLESYLDEQNTIINWQQKIRKNDILEIILRCQCSHFDFKEEIDVQKMIQEKIHHAKFLNDDEKMERSFEIE
eukprot:gene722-8974_t